MPANKTALLTVGSTEFTPLVQAALGDDVQAALTGSGFTQFTVQYGKSRLGKGYDIGYSSAGVVRTVQRAGISIHLLPFVADIEQRMASSDLVISHAGAQHYMHGQHLISELCCRRRIRPGKSARTGSVTLVGVIQASASAHSRAKRLAHGLAPIRPRRAAR